MRRALLSVTDKAELVGFASGLSGLGFEIVSTGGTAKRLAESGIPVTEVSAVTGFPEALNGRVKTLHPRVHAGLLADLRVESHREGLAELGVPPISVLAVNLYAFERTITAPHDFETAIEAIDIGGPAMIRAAAKNHANVLVVVDPGDYARVLAAIREGKEDELRLKLAAKAFRHTAFYDSMIARYLSERCGDWPFAETLTMGFRHDGGPLRYGENPHQRGARYLDPLDPTGDMRRTEGGKEISYNNWLDADAAWRLAADLPAGSCVIVKHGNPCGAAALGNLGDSYRAAKQSDPVSSFGGVVAFHGKLDESAIEAMTEPGNFLEVIVAPGPVESKLADKLRQGAAWTRNVRFVEAPAPVMPAQMPVVRSVSGGVLVQDVDADPGSNAWRVVTALEPNASQRRALEFAWTVVRHVKSNAIVVSGEDRLFGVGAGQMNRVQSVRLALEQAGDRSIGAALASDAFFPFPDSVHAAADAGVAAIVQPGGSKKDPEVIAAANERGIAMVLTGVRHFRH